MKFTSKLGSFQGWLCNILSEEKIVYLIVFFTAFLIRLIPELIIPNYPIGYETITYYALAMTPSSIVMNGEFFTLIKNPSTHSLSIITFIIRN